MRAYDKSTQTVYTLAKISCDKCKRQAHVDDLEAQEFLHIQHTCGYESIFGDGEQYEIDLCQYCVKELLGKVMRGTG